MTKGSTRKTFQSGDAVKKLIIKQVLQMVKQF